MTRPMRICGHPGCTALTKASYCDQHQRQIDKKYDQKRKTARERGYTSRWDKYSRSFLSRPENAFCVLRLDARCAEISQCVDHIDPPDGPKDPRFWDKNNHQAACLHCNSVKGRKCITGNKSDGEGRGGINPYSLPTGTGEGKSE